MGRLLIAKTQGRGDAKRGRFGAGETQGRDTQRWKIQGKENLEREDPSQGRPRERKTQGEEPQTPRISTIRCLDEQRSEEALHSPSHLKMVSDVIDLPLPRTSPQMSFQPEL